MEVKIKFDLNTLEIKWQCECCGDKVTTKGMSDLLDGPPLCPTCADDGVDEVMDYEQEAFIGTDSLKIADII